ncbi:MAG: hypothetical protein ACREX8_15950 [Gammaproteobacteria bacterium]
MQRPDPVDSQATGPPSRARLFLTGALGLPVAIVLSAALEATLQAAGSDGSVPELYFAAVAGLTPVLALGLLVQLLTALMRRTRNLLREVRRFDDEMSAETPQLVEESHQDRMAAWATARLFLHAIVPFAAGLVLQLVVTEAVAIACLVAEIDDRFLALALGAEVVALFVYLLFFGRMLAGWIRPSWNPSPP